MGYYCERRLAGPVRDKTDHNRTETGPSGNYRLCVETEAEAKHQNAYHFGYGYPVDERADTKKNIRSEKQEKKTKNRKERYGKLMSSKPSC